MKILLLLVVTAALMTAVRFLVRSALKASCRKGAAKIYRELTSMFSGEHEFRIVPDGEASPGSGPAAQNPGTTDADRELRATLQAAGFHRLGWIEDLTASRIYPHLRSFIECHASADGRVCATVLRVAGFLVFELGTRLPGDRFVITSNAEMNRLQPPPSTEREVHAQGTSFEVLHGRHLERLAERGLDPSRVVACRSMDDVLAGSRLYSVQASAHRRAIGYLSRQELLEMGARVQREEVASLVWEEFCRLRDDQRRAA